MNSKLVNKLHLFLCLLIFFPNPVWGEGKNEEENFIRTGTIAFSEKYILAEDFSHIIFKIKNHNPRSLSQIFAWVYRVPASKEVKNGKNTKLFLVNNPHRGGILVKGRPHRPGKKAQWRFLLDRNMEGVTEKDKFILRASPKSVFFPSLEPPSVDPPDKRKK